MCNDCQQNDNYYLFKSQQWEHMVRQIKQKEAGNFQDEEMLSQSPQVNDVPPQQNTPIRRSVEDKHNIIPGREIEAIIRAQSAQLHLA